MFDVDMLGVHLIHEEKISDIHVSGPFCAGTVAVLFQKDRACIVLGHPEKPLVNGFGIILKYIIYTIT
jgi:hypothetical protein